MVQLECLEHPGRFTFIGTTSNPLGTVDATIWQRIADGTWKSAGRRVEAAKRKADSAESAKPIKEQPPAKVSQEMILPFDPKLTEKMDENSMSIENHGERKAERQGEYKDKQDKHQIRRRKRLRMDIAAYAVGIVASICLILFQMHYNTNKTKGIVLFGLGILCFDIAVCLLWQDRVWKSEAKTVNSDAASPTTTPKPLPSPGSTNPTAEQSPGKSTRQESTPAPKPEPTERLPKKKQGPISLVAPPSLAGRPWAESTVMPTEELNDDERRILSIVLRCGSVKLFPLERRFYVPHGYLDARLRDLQEGGYLIENRSFYHGNRFALTPKGKEYAERQKEPFPIRPLDDVPPWPPPLKAHRASRLFDGPPPWTAYKYDTLERLLWRWDYNDKMNDGVPRGLAAICPECLDERAPALDGPLTVLENGLYVRRLECPSHPGTDKRYDIVGDFKNGDHSSIMRLIIINIRDGGWRVAVKQQGGYPS
jgi:hypothetical protein